MPYKFPLESPDFTYYVLGPFYICLIHVSRTLSCLFPRHFVLSGFFLLPLYSLTRSVLHKIDSVLCTYWKFDFYENLRKIFLKRPFQFYHIRFLFYVLNFNIFTTIFNNLNSISKFWTLCNTTCSFHNFPWIYANTRRKILHSISIMLNANFWFFSCPQHHCRNCGDIFCASCSDNSIALPGTNKSVRVCDGCYHLLLEQYTVVVSR